MPSEAIGQLMDSCGRRLLIGNPSILTATSLSFKKGETDILGLCDVLRKNMTTVSTLSLADQLLDAEMGRLIGLALRTNTTLTSLDLKNNRIGDAGAEAIGEALQVNKTLTSLNVDNNGIGDVGTRALAKGICFSKHMVSLNMWFSDIRNDGAIAMAEMLKTNEAMRSLYLWGPNMGDSGVSAICEAAANSSLTSFGLKTSGLTVVGIKSICNFLYQNKTVEALGLEGMQLKGEPAQMLGDALKANGNVKSLHMTCNGLGDTEKSIMREAVKGKPGFTLSLCWNKQWIYEKL